MALMRRMQIVPNKTPSVTMDAALKIAFCTNDLIHVNQHFGSARSFAIHAVTPDGAELLEVAEFGQLDQDGNEDKLASKIDALDGCTAVYCQAIGGSAMRQLMAKGIQPVKVIEGSVIAEHIRDLQGELQSGPTAWLAKAINKQKSADMSRFDEMEADGWDE